MVDSAMALLRQNGASSTTIDKVLSHSGAPRGSVYHHFPRGRIQLIEEAISTASDRMTTLIEETLQADDPVEAIDAFFALWRDRLVDSDFRSGCPIVAVAVETNDESPHLARSAGDIFVRWQDALTELFRKNGIPEDRSRRLAALVIAAEEGAVVLSRAQQSTAPMEAATAEIHDLLTHTLDSKP
ncbi:TetR/AcrR family transcriptional regulator [Curtobacterium sp. S6]|uniref:TetR/AcrR family transcriptional regulator n=1 Tax=Curtobacterium sp. S6 TaxID=1479623 RepID=UPI0004AAF2ED|nr:TetR/AcrR family transcriptional regulator [Curtobacterium sp. S6]